MHMHENADKIRPTSFGWLGIVFGLEPDAWLAAAEAAQLAHVRPATLRRFGQAGLVTTLQWKPREHYRYMASEMRVIGFLAEAGKPMTLKRLRLVVDGAFMGVDIKRQGRPR